MIQVHSTRNCESYFSFLGAFLQNKALVYFNLRLNGVIGNCCTGCIFIKLSLTIVSIQFGYFVINNEQFLINKRIHFILKVCSNMIVSRII